MSSDEVMLNSEEIKAVAKNSVATFGMG